MKKTPSDSYLKQRKFQFSACGAAGLNNKKRLFGRGACVTSDFRMEQGETINILVGKYFCSVSTEFLIVDHVNHCNSLLGFGEG